MPFVRPVKRNLYNIFDQKGLKFLTRLRLGFSQDISIYSLHCHHFSHYHIDLMSCAKLVCDNFESMPNNVKKNLLLLSDLRFDENKNKAAISYIKNSGRLSVSVFE